MRKLHAIFLVYLILIAIFTPFTFEFVSFQTQLTETLFGGITKWMASLFGLQIDPYENFTSDSIQLYLLYLILFPLASTLVIIFSRFDFVKKYAPNLKSFFTSILVYYLALISLKYGLDKLNGNQFKFPEPNLLFTPLGYLDKDILYWSVMGASPGYLFFLGVIEVLVAVLLLIRKTRVFGIVFALITYTQVVAVNFGFDISVKLFSTYLLIVSLTLLYPYLLKVYHSVKHQHPLIVQRKSLQKEKVQIVIQSLAIVFILTESIYPAYVSYKLNHFVPTEENMYGAYEVNNRMNSRGIKRVFIHTENYLILQTEEDDFVDYKMNWSMDKQVIHVTDYDNQQFTVPYKWVDNKILVFELDSMEIQTSPIAIKDLPLSQPLFHWTVDQL